MHTVVMALRVTPQNIEAGFIDAPAAVLRQVTISSSRRQPSGDNRHEVDHRSLAVDLEKLTSGVRCLINGYPEGCLTALQNINPKNIPQDFEAKVLCGVAYLMQSTWARFSTNLEASACIAAAEKIRPRASESDDVIFLGTKALLTGKFDTFNNSMRRDTSDTPLKDIVLELCSVSACRHLAFKFRETGDAQLLTSLIIKVNKIWHGSKQHGWLEEQLTSILSTVTGQRTLHEGKTIADRIAAALVPKYVIKTDQPREFDNRRPLSGRRATSPITHR